MNLSYRYKNYQPAGMEVPADTLNQPPRMLVGEVFAVPIAHLEEKINLI